MRGLPTRPSALLGGLFLLAGLSGVAAEESRSLTDLYKALQAQKQDAAAQSSQEKLARERADALRKQVASLRAQMIETAAHLQDREEKMSGLEQRLKLLVGRAQILRQSLDLNEDSAARTLAALERIALSPPEAILGRPVHRTVDTIRTAMMLRAVLPDVETEAASLRSQIEALMVSRNQIAQDREALSEANRQLQADRTKLTALISQRQQEASESNAQAEREAERTKAISAKADDLRQLIQSLEQEAARARAEAKARAAAEAKARAAALRAREQARNSTRGPSLAALVPPAGPPGSAAPLEPPGDGGGLGKLRGTVRLPARGQVVRWFGQKDAYGTRSRGITLLTRPAATVTAPVSGKVVFAGPFRDYGQLLIISPAAGYHVLIAGLSRIDAINGQNLLAGEPVGQMASPPDRAPNEPAGPSGTRRASAKLRLYLEFRSSGEPIDPAPLLAASERKVSG